MTWIDGWLADLAAARSDTEREDALLWPRTPIGDEIQDRIRERVGASDSDVANPRSRSARLGALVDRLVRSGAAPPDMTVLDIACGDGLVLLELKRRVPGASCAGVDLNAGRFPSHEQVRAAGVVIEPVLIQDLFDSTPPAAIDVILMLNTYRGWENADLSAADRDLPERADRWLRRHGRVVVLTATDRQLEDWRAAGWRIGDLGRGEEASRLVCLSRRRATAGTIPALRASARRLARVVAR
jgi:SAM-dependent methyltransferase